MESYLRLLVNFAQSHSADFQKIRDCLLVNNNNEARRLAHSLKGAAGALGAHAVQHATAALESAITESRPAAEIFQLIEDSANFYARLQQDVARLKPDSTTTAENALDQNTVQSIIDNMRRQLRNSDFSATKTLASYPEVFSQRLGDNHKRFENCLNNFDFEVALTLLEQSLNNTNSHVIR